MFRYGWMFCVLVGFSVQAHIDIEGAVIRVLPPGSPSTSAYFDIHNDGEQDRCIVAATSPIAKNVELHKHIMTQDMMRMEKQDKVCIKAGDTVTFEPGGLHLMFFGLKQSLSQSQLIDVSIQMQDGEQIAFKALAVEPGSQLPHH